MEILSFIGLILLCLLLLIITEIGPYWREIWFVFKPTLDPEFAELKRDIVKIWKLRARTSWFNFKHNLHWGLFELYWDIKNLPGKIRRRLWNKHILLTWHRLWIRQDEFHSSLDLDPLALMEMDETEREKYIADLIRRRMLAHNREVAEQDAKLSG